MPKLPSQVQLAAERIGKQNGMSASAVMDKFRKSVLKKLFTAHDFFIGCGDISPNEDRK